MFSRYSQLLLLKELKSTFYNPITVLITSNGVNVGTGSIPAFTHGTKNITTLRTTLTSTGESVDGPKLNLKKKSLPLKIQLDTKVKVKIGGMKTKKIRIRVNCRGIKATLPAGKTATTADAKCKMDIRIKIWKWTVWSDRIFKGDYFIFFLSILWFCPSSDLIWFNFFGGLCINQVEKAYYIFDLAASSDLICSIFIFWLYMYKLSREGLIN